MKLLYTLARIADTIPHSIIALMARLAVATPFWLSARTKVDGIIEIIPSTLLLFEYEYDLPIIPFKLAAYLATYAEHLFSILLVIGLAARFSAASLLIMTMVIQIFVYPSAWATHLIWATCLVYIIGRGAGVLSLDRVFFNRN